MEGLIGLFFVVFIYLLISSFLIGVSIGMGFLLCLILPSISLGEGIIIGLINNVMLFYGVARPLVNPNIFDLMDRSGFEKEEEEEEEEEEPEENSVKVVNPNYVRRNQRRRRRR